MAVIFQRAVRDQYNTDPRSEGLNYSWEYTCEKMEVKDLFLNGSIHSLFRHVVPATRRGAQTK
jgi:hypothetical protein